MIFVHVVFLQTPSIFLANTFHRRMDYMHTYDLARFRPNLANIDGGVPFHNKQAQL